MQLNKKKELAARTFNVGKERIVFNIQRLDEIKEAITKQDIRDLHKDKAILIDQPGGRKKHVTRRTRRRAGSIKKTVNTRKQDYMIITRKLRAFIAELRTKKVITSPEYWKLRKEIRAKNFKSKAQMKERITQMVKEREA